MTDQATPRPWTYTKTGNWIYITKGNSIALPNIIATIEQNGDDEEANAQLIVRAVNEYNFNKATIARLEEACRQAQKNQQPQER